MTTYPARHWTGLHAGHLELCAITYGQGCDLECLDTLGQALDVEALRQTRDAFAVAVGDDEDDLLRSTLLYSSVRLHLALVVAAAPVLRFCDRFLDAMTRTTKALPAAPPPGWPRPCDCTRRHADGRPDASCPLCLGSATVLRPELRSVDEIFGWTDDEEPSA